MATQLSREKAAQAWCKPKTCGKEMDGDLAEAFAEILDEIWSQPWLGNATTGQLLDEIRARVNTNYRTVDPNATTPPIAVLGQRGLQHSALCHGLRHAFNTLARGRTLDIRD